MMVLCEPKHVGAAFIILTILIICVYWLDNKVFGKTDSRCNRDVHTYFIKIHPAGADLFHSDEQTDMTKLIVTFRSVQFWSCCSLVAGRSVEPYRSRTGTP